MKSQSIIKVKDYGQKHRKDEEHCHALQVLDNTRSAEDSYAESKL